MPAPSSSPFHFTPLRYPGGKGKLVSFVRGVLTDNGLIGGTYVEPYAGGAAIAIELLLTEYVSEVHLNDISKPIFAFWHSILDDTEAFLRRLRDTPCTPATWHRQKEILKGERRGTQLDLGFATFFLNRTNRSGVLNAGMIGGHEQLGPWKIDARYNRKDLAKRIELIASKRQRIHLSNNDAIYFLSRVYDALPEKTLIYFDPPYFQKGRQLYYDYYRQRDHEMIAKFICERLKKHHWMVSYDNVPQVRRLYVGSPMLTYSISYSARQAGTGREAMFFSPALRVPHVAGAMFDARRYRMLASV